MARAGTGTIERNFIAPDCLALGDMKINALWDAYNLSYLHEKNRRENLMARADQGIK